MSLVHPYTGKSWFTPDKKKKKKEAIWISDDGTNTVDMFNTAMVETGSISGFSEPQGMCTDKKGNVWITNTGTLTVLEYSKTGKAITSLSDPDGYPVGCAISSSGDLAVTNIFGLSGAGNVAVYKNATGTPTEVSNPSQYYYYFDGYDTSGNLYVSGKSSSATYMLSECASGGSSCSTVTLTGGTVYFPGMVQWDKKTKELAVGDQSCGDVPSACIYQVSISGATGTIKDTTTLENYEGGAVCDLVQGEINSKDNQVAGGDYEYCTSTTKSSANIWPFTTGGKPTAYNDTDLTEPIGTAITK